MTRRRGASKDAAELITTLEKGMATPEYAAFLGELQAAGPGAMDP